MLYISKGITKLNELP